MPGKDRRDEEKQLMTKLEAMKEAARRDGWDPAMIERGFQRIVLANALPCDAYDELLAGEVEPYIERQMTVKREVDTLRQMSPPALVKQIDGYVAAFLAEKSKNN
jgi:hypothetical protein